MLPLASWLALAALAATEGAPSDCAFPDHLEPDEGAFSRSTVYDGALRRALLRGTEREIQMVVVPSFAPEQAVYVDRTGSGPRVVAVRLRSNLHRQAMRRVTPALDAAPERADGDDVAVREWTVEDERLVQRAFDEVTPEVDVDIAPISPATVERLKALWIAALTRARRPEPCDEEIAVSDGVVFHLAGWSRSVGYLSGQIRPLAGPKPRMLIEIGLELAGYARAPDAERRGREKALLAKAEALLARFEAEARPREKAN
jgi:hypothetical protein